MISKLQQRLAREESGFTLIELLVVIIILGILMAIAIPSYLSFKDRANKTAAASNVRSLIPSIEAFNSDNNASPGGYTGMTAALLKSTYDASIDTTKVAVDAAGGTAMGVTITAPAATTYCAVAKVGNYFAWKKNPDGAIQTSTDPAAVCV